MVTEVRLRPPRAQDEAPGRLAHQLLQEDGYAFFLDYDSKEPWPEFIDRVERWARGIDVPPDRVAAAFLMAWVGDSLVGRSSIRFGLNEYLASGGGHIGYAVLPAQRKRGYATEILRQSLIVAREHGVEEVLVTCAVDNMGSRAVIERCGGEFESTVHDPREGVLKRRYWLR